MSFLKRLFGLTDDRRGELLTSVSDQTWVSDSGEWGAGNGRVVMIPPGGGDGVVASSEANGFTNGLAIDPDARTRCICRSTRSSGA